MKQAIDNAKRRVVFSLMVQTVLLFVLFYVGTRLAWFSIPGCVVVMCLMGAMDRSVTEFNDDLKTLQKAAESKDETTE